MATPRQEKLLIALVREYIMNPQPVGSSALLSKLRANCSSATIRNELKILEENGYLCKSHTSSGRIPLKKAYRLYIDRLLEQDLSAPQDADKIKQEFCRIRREIENPIQHASKILSDLSHYTSFILEPNIDGREGKIFCEGILNLLEVPGIKDLRRLKQVLELLNKEKFIARVVSKTISRVGIQVYMGSEFLPFDDDFSLITVSYRVKKIPAGTMGILGPMRMHYEKVLPLVKFTAESFTRKLEKIF